MGMRRTFPAFIEPRFQVMGSQNPVGVLTFVVSPKGFEAMRSLFLETARQASLNRSKKELPRSVRGAVVVHSLPDYPDLVVEIELSTTGWELIYLKGLVDSLPKRDPLLELHVSNKREFFWWDCVEEAMLSSKFTPKWEYSQDDLQRCGADWLITLVGSLAAVRLPSEEKKGKKSSRRGTEKTTRSA